MLPAASRTAPAKQMRARRPGADGSLRRELAAGRRFFGFASDRNSASAASPNRTQLTAGGVPRPWDRRLSTSTTAAPVKASAPATSGSAQRERAMTATRRPPKPYREPESTSLPAGAHRRRRDWFRPALERAPRETPQPQQVERNAGRRPEQPDTAVGIVGPPHRNLGDTEPELNSDQAELRVEQIALDVLVLGESVRHVRPEQLEAALGVPEREHGGSPEQAVARFAEQLA